jgi:CheY-like chemotaxis protein
MRIDSEVGRGTTFRLYVPMPPVRPEVRTPDEVARGHGARVLVVVETAGKLSLLSDVIASHGYRVTTAQNGAVALQSLDREGLPDAVVMEARMNLMTGVRTAAALGERDFSGPVLLIARPDDAAIGEEIPPLRRVRFIDKPVDPLQLLSVLAEETATREADA